MVPGFMFPDDVVKVSPHLNINRLLVPSEENAVSSTEVVTVAAPDGHPDPCDELNTQMVDVVGYADAGVVMVPTATLHVALVPDGFTTLTMAVALALDPSFMYICAAMPPVARFLDVYPDFDPGVHTPWPDTGWVSPKFQVNTSRWKTEKLPLIELSVVPVASNQTVRGDVPDTRGEVTFKVIVPTVTGQEDTAA